MQGTRHPHPHIDPRQPRNGAKPPQNPPVFAWKPAKDGGPFHLIVGRDEAFKATVVDEDGLAEPAFLPEKAFEKGRYFWKWSDGENEGEVFTFDVPGDSVIIEVPPVGEWLRRLPEGHPRIYIRPEEVPALRESREGERKEAWEVLRKAADELLKEEHEYPEPPFLPYRQKNYKAYYDVWSRILNESRRFVQGAMGLGLAWLASGEKKYARAACRRMASVSRWNPEGSSHISHNDEAHMSVVWWGSPACDWAWDEFTDDERSLVIDQFRKRGEITYDFMHGKGSYGITRFDSHAGREIVFLALTALVFHEHIPDAKKWLEWLRPVLCGIWPVWAEDDGAWAEGPLYGLAYVDIMTMFATALKRAVGVDLYKRPFWRNHAEWRRWIWPPYAEWLGFGDCWQGRPGPWLGNSNLVERIARETGAQGFAGYVDSLRSEASKTPGPAGPDIWRADPQRYLSSLPFPQEGEGEKETALRIFPGAGWAAVRTDFREPVDDLAFIFRSSPYGSISHSHANNNDFILHVAGRVMLMPSGYYTGYGSDHHAHWNWHTRSHNCVTLSEAGQLMRSHDSLGRVVNAYEDDHLAYFAGFADESYQDRAERCRRHVVFLKKHRCLVLIDEFKGLGKMVSALQWNAHSWNEFDVDEGRRMFRIERGDSAVEGHFMYHHNAFFTLTEGWDPPPMPTRKASEYDMQYNLRFTATGLSSMRNLGVVLVPSSRDLSPPKLTTERVGDTEVARVGQDAVLVNQSQGIDYEGIKSDALSMLIIDGTRYEVRDEGIKAV